MLPQGQVACFFFSLLYAQNVANQENKSYFRTAEIKAENQKSNLCRI